MKKGFDSREYTRRQTSQILERISRFDNKLYLEFGGKIFDDFHAARVLPGFDRRWILSGTESSQRKKAMK